MGRWGYVSFLESCGNSISCSSWVLMGGMAAGMCTQRDGYSDSATDSSQFLLLPPWYEPQSFSFSTLRHSPWENALPFLFKWEENSLSVQNLWRIILRFKTVCWPLPLTAIASHPDASLNYSQTWKLPRPHRKWDSPLSRGLAEGSNCMSLATTLEGIRLSCDNQTFLPQGHWGLSLLYV